MQLRVYSSLTMRTILHANSMRIVIHVLLKAKGKIMEKSPRYTPGQRDNPCQLSLTLRVLNTRRLSHP
jgi:hypothetical protein